MSYYDDGVLGNERTVACLVTHGPVIGLEQTQAFIHYESNALTNVSRRPLLFF